MKEYGWQAAGPSLAAQIRGLRLSRSQAEDQEEAAAYVEKGRLTDALPLVQSFGIGEGQVQAGAWHQIRRQLGER